MDHSHMDHSKMDHSAMDHGDMGGHGMGGGMGDRCSMNVRRGPLPFPSTFHMSTNLLSSSSYPLVYASSGCFPYGGMHSPPFSRPVRRTSEAG